MKYLLIPMRKRVATEDETGRPYHNLTIRGKITSVGIELNFKAASLLGYP